MTATVRDYLWIHDDGPFSGLIEGGYTLTFVEGLSPVEVLDGLGAQPRLTSRGVEALQGPFQEAWTVHGGLRQLVAVTAGPGWAVCLEANGFVGVTEELIVPLSRGRRLVSHYRNVNAVDRFYLVEDGDVRLSFEPLFASQRHGSDPDGLLDALREVGLRPRRGPGPRGTVAAHRGGLRTRRPAHRRQGHSRPAGPRLPGRLGRRPPGVSLGRPAAGCQATRGGSPTCAGNSACTPSGTSWPGWPRRSW